MTERWLPIPGYEGSYDVSDEGRVRSWLAWNGNPVPRLLVPAYDSDGYQQVGLMKDRARARRGVHCLVLLAFVGSRPEALGVTRHLDGDRTNNRLSNLAYGTSSENMFDRVRHGTHHCANRTRCAQGHPYDEANTYIYKSRRACKACRAVWHRNWKARKRSAA